jgi:hypothetical protein
VATARRWLLLPQEHGTYGEIFFPLVTALVIGRPGPAAWALALAAAAGYFAQEGVLVLAGWRGARARRELAGPALASLALFGSAALLAGGVGLALAGPAVRLALAAAGAASAAVIGLALKRRLKTAAGEMLVGAVLPAWGVPVAMAGGVSFAGATVCWALWTAAFAGATLAVRAVIARTRREASGPSQAGAALVATAAVLAAWVLPPAGTARGWLVAGLLPTVLVTLVVAWGPVPAQALRRVGWTLIGASGLLLAGMARAL